MLQGSKIASVFRVGESTPACDREIDCRGLAIAPGFIDMHSHVDWVLPSAKHPEILKCLVEQGITTVIGGNCGISPAPVKPESIALIEALASIDIADPLDYGWSSMGEFLRGVAERGPIVNLAQLVGHASLRYFACADPRGEMRPNELHNVLEQARRALDEGACGLSFGLQYDPGLYSPLDELQAFCGVAADCGKPVTVHLRAHTHVSGCYPHTHRAHNELALEEMLEIAKRSEVQLQVSHLFFMGRRSWPSVDRCLDRIDEAREEGLDVKIDAFPFTCANTTINILYPAWFLAGIPAFYRDETARARLRSELTIGLDRMGTRYEDLQIMDPAVPGWEALSGMHMGEVAEKLHCDPFEAVLELAEKSNGSSLILFHGCSGTDKNEGVLEKVLSHDLCLFQTDAAIKAGGYPNPASLGAFPRILGRYVRERKLFSLENAIHRMTMASAERFGLNDIGHIRAGKSADIVVFDPGAVTDSQYSPNDPPGRPKGIAHVFINGEHVVEHGLYQAGKRAGKVYA